MVGIAKNVLLAIVVRTGAADVTTAVAAIESARSAPQGNSQIRTMPVVAPFVESANTVMLVPLVVHIVPQDNIIIKMVSQVANRVLEDVTIIKTPKL